MYPISIAGIRMRLKTELTQFSRLYRYDKKKGEEKYSSDAHNFLKKN